MERRDAGEGRGEERREEGNRLRKGREGGSPRRNSLQMNTKCISYPIFEVKCSGITGQDVQRSEVVSTNEVPQLRYRYGEVELVFGGKRGNEVGRKVKVGQECVDVLVKRAGSCAILCRHIISRCENTGA
jgi:hypothetical protein